MGRHLLFEDSQGRIWTGSGYKAQETVKNGLAEIRDGRLARAYSEADGLPSVVWRSAAESPGGALWFGSARGFVSLAGGKFTHYQKQEGFPNEYVRDIFVDDDGALWLATYGGGLSRFKDGRFTSVSTREGLFDDFVSRILTDDAGNFWLLGNQGIFAVNRAALRDVADGRSSSVTCVALGKADGMITSEGQGGSFPAGWRGGDGKLWFPMIKGFVMLDPKNALPTVPPTPVLEEARLEGQPLDLRQPLTVPPGQGNLEIRYTGISFHHPEQIRFHYQLEGSGQDWVDAGTRRTAYFSHLPPGAYRFVLRALRDAGAAGLHSTSAQIVVIPPFWRRWWFISLIGVGIVGLLGIFWRARSWQIKRAAQHQLAISRQLLNAQEAERARIARELHDGLSQHLLVIKNWAVFGLQASGNDTGRLQLEQISESASEALAEVRQTARNLSPYQLERAGLTRTLQFMAKQVGAASGIDLVAEIEPLDGLLPRDAEINLYRIVQEALNNIVKHAQASQARVCATVEADVLTVLVEDNGKGLPDKPLRSGLGLKGMKERAALIGGKFTASSPPRGGTRLTVTVPLKTGAS